MPQESPTPYIISSVNQIICLSFHYSQKAMISVKIFLEYELEVHIADKPLHRK